MDTDNPEKPEFASYRSYWDFAKRVRFQQRYVWDEHVKAFIATVLATLKDRDVFFRRGAVFFRAQRGIEYAQFRKHDPEEPVGYSAARMKPRPNRAMEGRANASGVPVLYLGNTEQTVISEVRPWVGADISVAQLKLKRKLKVVNLSRGHGLSAFGSIPLGHFLEGIPPTLEQKETAVWIDIDNAFSKPVTLADDTADYVPTQILAEVFRHAGYDGIIYKSQFGQKGYNIALFNPDDAIVMNCAPYSVTGFDVSFELIGNRWFTPKRKRSSKPKRGGTGPSRKAGK
ncbi:RES family NAD+ phosphorylase [Mesorhizobium sp. BH1-1-4]|uniref:RES family NAD+ phosphorylase n=1 Tax=Mesorhizobium sp. BH1-1-4 TaxID=2876662 RepID=UPI001CD0DF29|nr:RES family NAD+ phosphorylase [Mesorhizobium sp. BH1-1-4]MBZ9996585.1 RES family NAD+ phosphorylase [Mesorhizobium sp. BH1-1-4]